MPQYPPFELRDKRCLITGASSGIGRALAIEAAQRGASLLLSGRDEQRLEQTRQSCQEAGATGIELYAADLCGEEARLALSEATRPLDVCVLNAGLLQGGDFEDSDPEGLTRLLRLNIEAPIHFTRLIAKDLIERSGALVLVSSGVARSALPYCVAYNSSKVALSNFGRALAYEWAHRRLPSRVLVTHPGATDTPMLAYIEGEKQARTGADKKDPAAVASSILDALASGKDRWWASAEPGLRERLRAIRKDYEEQSALDRASSLREFFTR